MVEMLTMRSRVNGQENSPGTIWNKFVQEAKLIHENRIRVELTSNSFILKVYLCFEWHRPPHIMSIYINKRQIVEISFLLDKNRYWRDH